MSGNCDALQLRQDDVVKFLSCQAHIGSPNVDFQMEQYVYKRRSDGIHIINIRRTWEKLLLAARAIVAIENPADICVISARHYGQRAILKFAAHTGANAIAGRFTPGTFTNQIQKAFKEPRLLIVTDPRTDHQAITEASYVNIPVIGFCNTDSPLKLVDIAIPCNNKGQKSIGLMWWMLAREVLILRGQIVREIGTKFRLPDSKEVMVDLYFYRDPEEAEKEEAPEKAAKESADVHDDRWGNEVNPAVPDWTGDGAPVPAAATATAAAPGGPVVEDWAAETQAEWSATQAAQGTVTEWGGGAADTWA